MLLRLVPALATLLLTLLLVADTGADISKCSNNVASTCVVLTMCSGPDPAVEACAMAARLAVTQFLFDPAVYTLFVVSCHPGP